MGETNLINEHGIILCGDLNCAMEKIDRNTNKSNKSTTHLNNLKVHLSDSFRQLHPSTRKQTYSNLYASYQSRIDYIFISDFLKGFNKNIVIKPVPKMPNHKAVILSLKIEMGTEYWKLNTNWLQKTIFIVNQ